MKTKKLLLLLGIITIFLYSCSTSTSPGGAAYEGPGGGRENGRFYAFDFVTEKSYSLTAEMLHEGSHCKVWAEKNMGIAVTKPIAKEVADTFDNDIYPRLIDAFGFSEPLDLGGGITKTLNSMELADFFGDGDEKLCILLMDINKGSGEDYFVAGYFDPYNFIEYDPADNYTWYSNECDMIYIDVKVKGPTNPDMFGTLAHEMQHMMNLMSSVVYRQYGSSFIDMDLWINEGLSAAAEYVGTLSHNQERIEWFNYDPTGFITFYGNNFYMWDVGYYPENVLDDYATVYLFFQWLRLQSGGVSIYKNIINSGYDDYRAVTTAAGTAMGSKYSNWGTLLRDWLAANYINSPTSEFGYKGDLDIILEPAKDDYDNPIKLFFLDWLCDELELEYDKTTPFVLSPGEGVYTKTTGTMPTSTTYVKYAGLDYNADAVNDTGASPVGTEEDYDSGALLSYCVATNMSYNYDSYPFSLGSAFSPEPVAGIKKMTNILPQNHQTSLQGPYAISMGDMLKMRNAKVSFDYDPSKIIKQKVSAIHE